MVSYYKRHSIRLPKLDYGLPNQFFITICTHKHGCYFKKFPELKSIVVDNICQLYRYFPNINTDIFVVMPNHLHLIISIKYQVNAIKLGKIISVLKSKIINDWLKLIKSKKINALASIWQRNYYEHRIRNQGEYKKFKKYILLNPVVWDKDKYNPKNFKTFENRRGLACLSPSSKTVYFSRVWASQTPTLLK